MTVDNLTGLAARDALLSTARFWPILENLVARGGNQAITGMPGGGEADTIPIDTQIVDLMTEIRNDIALHYARVLIDDTAGGDTAWSPEETDTVALLNSIAARYGHFTTHHHWADKFVRDAHNTWARVQRTCSPPTPPIYLGPCPTPMCEGELHLRQDRDSGMCPKCGAGFDRHTHEQWLATQLENRLMTQTEIARALKVAGTPITTRTLRTWASIGKIEMVEDGLYRFADALHWARQRHMKGSAA